MTYMVNRSLGNAREALSRLDARSNMGIASPRAVVSRSQHPLPIVIVIVIVTDR